MTIFEAIIQGIIQGLTEFLPVSSSGHLSLFQYFTGRSTAYGMLFMVLLHVGTLLAVFIAFRKTIWILILESGAMLRDIFTGKFTLKDMPPYRRMVVLQIVALLPMGLVFFLTDIFDSIAADQDIVIEGFAFMFTSYLLFLAIRAIKKGGKKKTAGEMTYFDALAMGAIQAIAPIPGISRSGSTIAVGLMRGLDRKFAIEFSFIMSLPTVIGATLMYTVRSWDEVTAFAPSVLVVGILVSLVFGLIAIRLLKMLVLSDKFKYLAWYTLILGIAVVVIGIFEHIAGQPIQAAVMRLFGS